MYFINNAFDCVSEREPRLAPLAGLLILFAHIAAQSKCARLQQRLPLFVWTLDAYLCRCATSSYTLCSVTPCPIYIYIYINLILLSEQSVCCDILYKNETDEWPVLLSVLQALCFTAVEFRKQFICLNTIGIKLTTNSTAVVALNC